MSNYTVKAGDNLWNIIKNQLKITNNAEIAQKVKEIAATNGMTKPGLIFPGQKIELGSAMDSLEKTSFAENPQTPTKKEYSPEITKAVDDKVKSWDVKTYDDVKASMSTKVSVFSPDTKTPEDKQKAYEDYSEKLLLTHYDLNKDGKVTSEEFAKAEEDGSLKTNEISRKHDKESGIYEASETDIQNDNRIANRTANLFAKNLDMNGDGIISKEEFAFFNKTADSLDGKEDGIIQANAEGAMFQSVTGMNANNKDINRVVNKYLQGETLNSDEQKILDSSSVKIRAALSKAAGIETAE